MITMTDARLIWEPDVENYKLENYTNLGVVPDGAFKRMKPMDELFGHGRVLGSLYGEMLGIKQWKLDMLKELTWEIIRDGRNPLDVTFHINKVFYNGIEHLVFWAL